VPARGEQLAYMRAPERNVGIGTGGRVRRGVAGAREGLIGRVTSTLAPNGGYALVYHYHRLGRVTFSCSALHIAGSVSRIEKGP